MRSITLAIICSLGPFLPSGIAAPTEGTCEFVFNPPTYDGSDIRAALKESSIIPDVLDDFTPSVSLHISYPSSHSDVSLGNSIPPAAAQAEPSFSITPLTHSVRPSRTLKPDTTYTLVLTDPDATSRSNPTMSQYLHWIATNITLASSPAENKNTAFSPIFDELIPYLGPAPPPKTGYHRYTFVLLVPSASTEATHGLNLTTPSERPHWGYGQVGKGVRDWAKDNDLDVVGANFFYSENDTQ